MVVPAGRAVDMAAAEVQPGVTGDAVRGACAEGVRDARAHCDPPLDDAFGTDEWGRFSRCLKGS